jgi:DNA-directed RNA polymerase specialized sigma24 family protein
MKVIFDEDAAQDAALRVWERRDTHDSAKGKFSAWANTIISGKRADHRRCRSDEQSTDLHLSEDDDFFYREYSTAGDVVFPCKESQLAFEMKAEGFSSADIARALGVTVGTAQVKMSQWRKKIALPIKVSRSKTGYRCRGTERHSQESETSIRAT